MTYKTSEALKLELKLLLELDLTPGVQSFPHPGPNSKSVFIFFDMNGKEWTNQKARDPICDPISPEFFDKKTGNPNGSVFPMNR